MRYLILIICYLVSLFAFSNCGGGPGFSDTPEINFISISKDTFIQGFRKDSILLTIGFRDGDGDLGLLRDTSIRNIILTDSRTQDQFGSYKIPDLDIAGAQSGIEGEITLKVFSTCCVPTSESIIPCIPSSVFPVNDLSLAIKLIDDSGKESNSVSTPIITLLCN